MGSKGDEERGSVIILPDQLTLFFMKAAIIDISRYPIVFVDFQPVELEEKDVDEYLNWHLKIVSEAKEKLAIVYNVDGGKYLSGTGRIKINEWNKKHENLLLEKLHGKAMVFRSIMNSTVLKIHLALLKTAVKHQVFTKMEDGFKWAESVTLKKTFSSINQLNSFIV
jgi:hypothetical protein